MQVNIHFLINMFVNNQLDSKFADIYLGDTLQISIKSLNTFLRFLNFFWKLNNDNTNQP